MCNSVPDATGNPEPKTDYAVISYFAGAVIDGGSSICHNLAIKLSILSSEAFILSILMKRLLLTFFALIIILVQQGSLEHAYHEHAAGEICDYCLNSKSLDHFTVNSAQPVVHTVSLQWKFEYSHSVILTSHTRYFSARAPPRFI